MTAEPTREHVDALAGPTVLELGAAWCGFCKPLGRSFRVKLWPTFVFLLDGVEVARLVRPRRAQDMRDALNKLR